jgi:hypothetical protein
VILRYEDGDRMEMGRMVKMGEKCSGGVGRRAEI